ncbi:hypothetical protein AALP_AA4G128900 [Arabis alpina]|uniref:Uncharacterized protein n=1 Tax=Arabis alpina TaxID=50452 RepID=A0A087H2W8_ARAAL|nr:hypothetical protein AALP_AA4G128900 [Arabis alpina]
MRLPQNDDHSSKTRISQPKPDKGFLNALISLLYIYAPRTYFPLIASSSSNSYIL